jgi:signal transduction histidine kinase
MPEPNLNLQAAALRRLLGADAVLYWHKVNDYLAFPLGIAPPGQMDSAFFPPELAGEVRLLKGEAAYGLLPLRMRTGIAPGTCAVLAVDDGEQRGILAAWHAGVDLAEQPLAEIMEFALATARPLFELASTYYEMHCSEARRMSGLADALPIGVIVFPAGNRPCYVNNLAAAWLDLPPGTTEAEHLSGRLAEFVQRTSNYDAIGPQVEAFVAGHGNFPLSGQVWRFHDAPGALRVTIAPIDPEHTAGWFWLLEDVSAAEAEAEAREWQRHLEWLNAELEQRVRERTTQLEQANEVMLHTNMELQRFTHAMAHDLQTPLRSIAGFSQLVQEAVRRYGDTEVDGWASQVVGNARRLQCLIQGLLSYARLDAQALRTEEVDMNQLFDEVVASLQAMISETAADVGRGDLPTVGCIRSQISQLLQNLIENGLKYNKAEQPRVFVSCEPSGQDWVFSVADNGMGIDPKHHERIFDIFKRLHTYAEIPGTGIGLALCRGIVERHGGRIWVESRPGEGSIFHFSLPSQREQAH